MEITSALFMFFSFLTMLVVWNVKKFQWLVLLVSSLSFYFLSCKSYTIIYVLCSLGSVYGATLFFESEKYKDNISAKRIVCTLTVILNIGILVVLKYTNFFINTLNQLDGLLPNYSRIPRVSFFASLAISYYTLQIVSYMLDSYWGIIKPQKNILKLFLFLVYFPLMISGPICRYSEIGESLFTHHDFDYDRVSKGMLRIFWGLFKKLAIANRIALVVNPLFNQWQEYYGIFIPASVILFTLQLYADFSGCMDIIIGVSNCFGITLPENFNGPFFSTSIQEFWQRWHISLGKWLRDYIMNPVLKSSFCQKLAKSSKEKFGKKQGKKIPAYFAMFFVWTAMGIWHGNSWKFVAGEGWWFFICIVLGQISEPLLVKINDVLHINSDSSVWKLWQRIRTFLIFCVGNLFFRAVSFKSSIGMIKASFCVPEKFMELADSVPDKKQALFGLFLLIFVFVIDYLKYKGVDVEESFRKKNILIRWIVYCLLILNIIFAATITNQEFLYAQF